MFELGDWSTKLLGCWPPLVFVAFLCLFSCLNLCLTALLPGQGGSESPTAGRGAARVMTLLPPARLCSPFVGRPSLVLPFAPRVAILNGTLLGSLPPLVFSPRIGLPLGFVAWFIDVLVLSTPLCMHDRHWLLGQGAEKSINAHTLGLRVPPPALLLHDASEAAGSPLPSPFL